ncbi:NAD(P)-dependent oxidoreductase [Bauldia sp.]|uniref:NAD(P)-dependent oxidoreductase n=1 Tax=Bauldia sp. TaxID=2575872 RepID=UPI003BAA2658
MTRILVIGASSGIGLETVRVALAEGLAVRAFSRSADRIAIEHPALERINGDALNPADIAAALDRVDAVVQTLGIAIGPQRLLEPIRLFSDATRILVPAMEAAGIERLITVTGFGAGDSASAIGCLERIPFRLLLGAAYDDKSIQESLIRNSALDWTIVRPVILTNGPASHQVHALVAPETWRWGTVSRADVAEFLVGQIGSNDYRKTAVVLTS